MGLVLLAAWSVWAADPGAELLNAARKGQTQQVATLITKGAAIESTEKDGRTALMLAAQRGHAETVKLLLDRGAKADARDRQGWTAYALALTEGRDEVVKLFPAQPPIRVALHATWGPDNLYSSCFLTPQQLAQHVAGLQLETVTAAALQEYASTNGRRAAELVADEPQVTLAIRARPGVSCTPQRTSDQINLAIDVKVTRSSDGATLAERTFGGGLKGLHARQATSPAQFGALFGEWARTHAGSIYWATVEAWLRAR